MKALRLKTKKQKNKLRHCERIANVLGGNVDI